MLHPGRIAPRKVRGLFRVGNMHRRFGGTLMTNTKSIAAALLLALATPALAAEIGRAHV